MTAQRPLSPSSAAKARDYRYDRTRSGPVFLLALVASVGAVSLVWAAYAGLNGAMEEERLAAPPDLRNVVTKIEDTGRAVKEEVREKLPNK